MDDVLTELCVMLGQSTAAELDRSFESALQKIGTYFDADRAALLHYNADTNQFRPGYFWVRSGIAPAGFALGAEDNDRFGSDALRGDARARERRLLESSDTTSYLQLPLKIDALEVGCLILEAVCDHRQWSEPVPERFEPITALLAASLVRRSQDIGLRDGNYRNFVRNCVEGVWRFELNVPLPLDLPETEQVEWLYREGSLAEVNDAMAAQYGFDNAMSMVGWRLDEFMPRTLPSSVSNLLAIVRSRFCMKCWETVELDKDGHEIIFLNNTIGDIEDGKLLRVWGTCLDITRLRGMENDARLHSAAVESLDEGCIIVDAQMEDMPILYVNHGFTAITGYAAADIMGRNPRILQGSDTNRSAAAQCRDAIARREPCRVEILNYRKDGSRFWNLMQISPIADDQGVLTHYVGVLTDVTGRRERDEEILQLRSQLAHVDRVSTLGELTGALAHEINQPLAAILSNAQAASRFLRDGNCAPDDLREILQDIIDDDKRAGEVVHRLRRFLRKEPPTHERLDVNRLLRDLVRLVRSDLIAKQVTLDLELSPNVARVMGDTVQLQQVILNLLMNASDAVVNQQPERRRIVVTTQGDDTGGVRLAVRDRGPGIDERDRKQIFMPFFSTKKEGMGLGLAISRSLVQANGGRLWVESELDRGTTFHLTLPTAPAQGESSHRSAGKQT